MYASVRRYRCDPAAIDELMHIIDDEFAEMLTDQAGFCDYQAVDCGDGALMTITLFRDRDGVERSNEIAADFVRNRLADYDIERTDVTAGEVLVSRAAADVLEPAHA
jgi:hypothetical protein